MYDQDQPEESWGSIWRFFTPQQKTSSLKMNASSLYIPKRDESIPLGEDSHFINVEKQTVGVADGIGSWRKNGIDAGMYARELMFNCVNTLNDDQGTTKHVDPKKLLEQAFEKTRAKGSSTACVLTLHDKTLHAANVGDSGFMVVRRGRVIYQSPVQHHEYNCPYQLGNSSDHPDVAQKLRVKVEVGDVVLVGTDGLFDNLFATDIEGAVRKHYKRGPQTLANVIAIRALRKSKEKDAVTPFSLLYAQKGGLKRKGGKKDDITVIVAFVVKSEYMYWPPESLYCLLI